LNASYRSPYGTFSAGYSYGNDSSQYNYGVTGGVVIHPHGVTLSQYLGTTNCVVCSRSTLSGSCVVSTERRF
ncbi:fimbria/pilus outer membrane usher protein, partial [Escherichia sp. SS-MK2]